MATGVASARFLNLHQRHRDLLKIANLGDFCGTRWQTNVIMIPTPGGKSHLMPPGKMMALHRKHTGHQSVRVTTPAPELEVVASRTDGQFFSTSSTPTAPALNRRVEIRFLPLGSGSRRACA